MNRRTIIFLLLSLLVLPSCAFAAGDVPATFGTEWRDGSGNPSGDTPLTAASLNNEVARSRRFVIAEDKDATDAPVSCGAGYNGYSYLIMSSPSGDWAAASTDDIAICTYQNSTATWVFVTPMEGYFAWVIDEDTFYVFHDGVWTLFSGGGVTTSDTLTDTYIMRGNGGVDSDVSDHWSITDAGTMTGTATSPVFAMVDSDSGTAATITTSDAGNMSFNADLSDDQANTLMSFSVDGTLALKLDSDLNATLSKSLYLYEQYAAGDDTAGLGQIWVSSTSPNSLYFTDDTGVDHVVATGSGYITTSDTLTDTYLMRGNGGTDADVSDHWLITDAGALTGDSSADIDINSVFTVDASDGGTTTGALVVTNSSPYISLLDTTNNTSAYITTSDAGNMSFDADVGGFQTNTLMSFSVDSNLAFSLDSDLNAWHSNSVYLHEQVDGDGPIAAYGEIWVKNDAPNTLWFTDDGGTDYQLGVGGGYLTTSDTLTDTYLMRGNGGVDTDVSDHWAVTDAGVLTGLDSSADININDKFVVDGQYGQVASSNITMTNALPSFAIVDSSNLTTATVASNNAGSLLLNADWANGQPDSTITMTLDAGTTALTIDSSLNATFENVIFIDEQAAAETPVDGYGQIWVKSDTPNTLWFTDDGGTDHQLAVGGGYVTTSDTLTNNYIMRGNGTTDTDVSDYWNITDTGELLVGTTTSQTISGISPVQQIHGTAAATSAASQTRWSNDTGGSYYIVSKSRGASVGSFSAVQDNDLVGGFQMAGDDGDSFTNSAGVFSYVDGAVSDGIVPGELSFLTANTSTGTLTVGLRVDADQYIYMLPTYSADLNGDTYRPLLIKNDGQLGYDSSPPTVLTFDNYTLSGGTADNDDEIYAVVDGADGAITLAELTLRTKDIAIENPDTDASGLTQPTFPMPVTITRVWCSTDTGTVTIQLDERSESTPNTGGTDILTSQLVCDNDTQATTSFSNADIAADAPINLDIDAVASSPTQVRIHIKARIQ